MYAPIELTRVILKDMPFFVGNGFPREQFIAEIWFMWLSYTSGIILLTLKLYGMEGG